MRLISQDGMIDVPYENVCVSINYRNKNQITVWNFGCEEYEIATMATYSTETKALKAMEMLQKQFLDYCCNYHSQSGVFCFPKDEEVEV